MTACPHLFRFCLLAAYVLLVCTPVAPAQGPKNVIPENQNPLSRTFPPPVAEQTPAGMGKFVIFTREPVGKEGEWDFIAGAWECIPSRPGVPVTKRAEFCHSSWNASPLLDVLVRDNSEHQYPRFVTLQVDAGDRNYKVNLYDINYRTWEVRSLWQGSQLSAFGVMKGNAFCPNADEWFSLDSSTGAIRKEVPFIPLDVDGVYWLVRKNGGKTGSWSYDPAKEKFVGHFGGVETPVIGDTRALLSPDGRSRAWVLVRMPDGWRGGVVSGTLLLQRDGLSEDIRVPVEMLARAGSGRAVIPTETSLEFTPDGNVEFTAIVEKAGTQDRVWTIEIASGKTRQSSRPHRSPTEPDFAMFDGVPAPDYLRPYLKHLTHFGRSGLAPAFLMHLGVLKKQPEYPDCDAGVSHDGRHIFFKAREGPLSNVFIYGDLQTKQIVRWASPDGIKSADSMEFVWVETPW